MAASKLGIRHMRRQSGPTRFFRIANLFGLGFILACLMTLFWLVLHEFCHDVLRL